MKNQMTIKYHIEIPDDYFLLQVLTTASINVTNSIENWFPYIDEAQETFIKPVLGNVLYDQLQSLMALDPVPPDDGTAEGKLADLVDWVLGSGKWGIVIPQRLLKVPDDGIVGTATLFAVNNVNQRGLHAAIFQARKAFIDGLVRTHPDQAKFHNGWMNRLNNFTFTA